MSGFVIDETTTAKVQELAYELMRERLYTLFGPGGSFRVTLGRATADEALFASTVADTAAWLVANSLEVDAPAEARRAIENLAPEHEDIWAHVESELLSSRTQSSRTRSRAAA